MKKHTSIFLQACYLQVWVLWVQPVENRGHIFMSLDLASPLACRNGSHKLRIIFLLNSNRPELRTTNECLAIYSVTKGC